MKSGKKTGSDHAICLYLKAHQPRRLKPNGQLAKPFDDEANRRFVAGVGAKCYLPVNQLIAELVRKEPGFKVCIGVSGVLLDQAQRFDTRIVESFHQLGVLARKTGQIEFVAMPDWYGMCSLFRDGNKEEFKHQIRGHCARLHEMLGVEALTFCNTDMLYDNSVASVAGELGFKAVLCEGRADILEKYPEGRVFRDKFDHLCVLPRNGVLSDAIRSRLWAGADEALKPHDWLTELPGELTLIGFSYESAVGPNQLEATRLFDLLRALPSLLQDGTIGRMMTATEAASELTPAGTLSVDETATSSWIGPGRNTDHLLGNRAQQALFSRYQDLEHRVKASGDDNMVDFWRHLGTSNHFRDMALECSSSSIATFNDPTEAILVYTARFTELVGELKGRAVAVIKRRQLRRPRILLVTPEVTELPRGFGNLAGIVSAKGGGLADISAALVAELLRLGLDVHVALPKYDRKMREYAHISQDELDRIVGLFQSSEPIHLVQDSAFSHLENVYQVGEEHAAVHRASAFQRAVINSVFDAAMPEHGKMLVHCNDWMTGLLPAAAKARGLVSLFTVHNIHTGRESLRELEECGIDVSRFWHDLYLERHPDSVANPWETVGVDFLLSGIRAADHVNTVSPTFLNEIVNGYFPDLIMWQVREAIREKHREGRASGIINAPKSTVDPRTAHGLYVNYDETNFTERKRQNKIVFQHEVGLRENPLAPLFFWPHRLFDQKGPGLLTAIALALADYYREDGLQIAVVANGDPELEHAFGTIACGSDGRIAYAPFDPMLSELGKAAADFILMPSLYEPCGLPQMEGMRYAALPIVRATGGLKDTVIHLDVKRDTGNGFVFNDFVPDALWWAVGEAMSFYRQPLEIRQRTIRRVMVDSMQSFNLEKTTIQYLRIYEQLLGEKLV